MTGGGISRSHSPGWLDSSDSRGNRSGIISDINDNNGGSDNRNDIPFQRRRSKRVKNPEKATIRPGWKPRVAGEE